MLRYQRDAAVYNVTSKLGALGLKLLLDLSLDYTPLWIRTAREPKAGQSFLLFRFEVRLKFATWGASIVGVL